MNNLTNPYLIRNRSNDFIIGTSAKNNLKFENMIKIFKQ